MRTPPYLKKGDVIGISATARKVSSDEMQAVIYYLEQRGYRVELSRTLFEQDHQFAGSDKQRSSGFQALLDNPEVKAIICARGGYGTVRIIDRLNFDHFNRRPKWIVGYSDITVLHAHIQQNFGIETLHAAMPLDFPTIGEDNIAASSLCNALEGKRLKYNIPPHRLNRIGNTSGEIVGGNLSILYSLTGTRSTVSTLGRILFIEDLDEYLYHIDRMMMNLKRARMIEGIKAIVVGSMSDMNDNAIPYGKTAEEIILDAVKEYDFPVCFGFPAGHLPDQVALIMGQRVELQVSQDLVSLSFGA